MEYRNLGRSGLAVARIGLGAIPFGTTLAEADAARVVSIYDTLGGNLIDTANLYGGGLRANRNQGAGMSETTVGRVLQGRRHRFVVATKGFWLVDDEPGPNRVGLSRAYLARHIEASLKRLQTDYIDLYQCHAFDFETPIEETLRALDDAVTAGKIRHVGVSNWDAWHVMKATLLARAANWTAPVSNQVWYNLLDRTVEHAVVPASRDQGVAIIGWGVTAGGLLSGAYDRDSQRPSTGRFAITRDAESSSWARLATARTWDTVDAVRRVADQVQRPPSNVATAWLLQAGACDVALIGGSSVEQYEAQFAAADLALTPQALGELTEVSAPPTPYPVDFLNTFARRGSPDYGGLR